MTIGYAGVINLPTMHLEDVRPGSKHYKASILIKLHIKTLYTSSRDPGINSDGGKRKKGREKVLRDWNPPSFRIRIPMPTAMRRIPYSCLSRSNYASHYFALSIIANTCENELCFRSLNQTTQKQAEKLY